MNVICYGVIPLRNTSTGWECFLVQHHKQKFWGFPKGHPLEGETPLAAAARELLEETELKIQTILHPQPLLVTYRYEEEGIWIDKKVYFYLAGVAGEPVIDSQELLQGQWCSLTEAEKIISFPEGKKLMVELKTLLSEMA